MKSTLWKRLMLATAILALPVVGFAQEATLSGTVTDATGGVLPGVTVRAVHEASGNTFETVTDERGAYRIPARIGVYRVTAELAGFTTVNRTGLELLVGQQAVINLQMSPSAVAESVTVTGEAPLIETTTSTLGGNIDPRQMQELPLNGRNFLDLSMLAPGARANSVNPGDSPMAGNGTFQINIDGQQVTNNCCGGSVGGANGVPNGNQNHQASFSRDAIAEFQYVANRFNATQGRSAGVQVNVVTKSGTNSPSGTFSGYFRSDKFNAEDFIAKRVLPYSNQQLSATFGGPIVKDKFHYFGNYEFERQPNTITYNSIYPAFNIDQFAIERQHKAATREDIQFSPRTRLSLYGNLWRDFQPIAPTLIGGATLATIHPSASVKYNQYSEATQAVLTHVVSTRALNELRVGWAATHWLIEPNVIWTAKTGLGAARDPRSNFAPQIQLSGYRFGPGTNYPQFIGQDVYTYRDDFTYSFNAGGRHDLKTGGEYLNYLTWHEWCNFQIGQLRADRGAALPPATVQALFPVWDDPNTWNLAGLPLSSLNQYQASLGNCNIHSPRNIFGFWYQDDWQVSSTLTLNLGVRYDLETDAFANALQVPNPPGALGEIFLQANRPDDTNNISPRLGFAWSVNDRTVIRGGAGIYFSEVINQAAHPVRFATVQVVPQVPFDPQNPRADFAVNPWNGPLPSFESIQPTFCNNHPELAASFTLANPGCTRRAVGQTLVDPNAQFPYSYQTSIGFQRQIGTAMSVSADYAYTGLRHDRVTGYNVNLGFNPATGKNYNFNTDFAHRPYPDWGAVLMDIFGGVANTHALQTSLTKRMSNRWQASGTYTLSGYWDGTPDPWSGVIGTPFGTGGPIPFQVVEPFNKQYGLAATDQRHRAVFNGIWDMGYGFQLSGLYFAASGLRYGHTYGGDQAITGATINSARVRPDGTATPRNDFLGRATHRVDVRLQRRFRLGGRASVDGLLEAFNLFNHENFGTYTTTESSGASFGQPSQNLNVAYQPRMMQLGFRASF